MMKMDKTNITLMALLFVAGLMQMIVIEDNGVYGAVALACFAAIGIRMHIKDSSHGKA